MIALGELICRHQRVPEYTNPLSGIVRPGIGECLKQAKRNDELADTAHILAVVSPMFGIARFIGIAQVQYSKEALAFSVGLAVLISMSVAALVGSFVPMAFARINIDPAVATGPFVTTAIDIISVFFYFKIATILLGI